MINWRTRPIPTLRINVLSRARHTDLITNYSPPLTIPPLDLSFRFPGLYKKDGPSSLGIMMTLSMKHLRLREPRRTTTGCARHCASRCCRYDFYPRCASDARALAVVLCMCVCVCVCVCVRCVCLTHAGIVSERLNVGSRKQRHVTAQRL